MQSIRPYCVRLTGKMEVQLPIGCTIFRCETRYHQDAAYYELRLWVLTAGGEPELETRIIHSVPLNGSLPVKAIYTDAPLQFIDTWMNGNLVQALLIEQKEKP